MHHSVAAKQQLKDAFDLFNQVSEQLTGSYEALQRQVSALEQKLADARAERVKLIEEIKTLHAEIGHTHQVSMTEIAARLSHQIRTPLSTALLYASQLKHDNLRKDQHHCFVDRLLTGLRHLDHMVNDMLVFAGGLQGGGEALAVNELLEQTRQSLLPQLEARDARWQVSASRDDLRVLGKREVLISTFANLANNALDACGASPRLEWSIEVAGPALRLVLQDNGPGIPQELAEQVFEPFFTTRPDGTGLGLAVARAVIDAHHGKITVDGTSRRGARFVISLPLCAPQQLPSEMMHKHTGTGNANSRYGK